jgi:hypothetical protein
MPEVNIVSLMARWCRYQLSGCHFKRGNGRVKRSNHLRVCSPRVVIPIRDWPDCLPIECVAGVLDRKSKLPAGALNGTESTKAPGKTRMNRDRDIEPGAGKRSFAPARFVSNESPRSDKHRDGSLDTLVGKIPMR